MAIPSTNRNGAQQLWVIVRPQSAGLYKAEMVGLPEIHATGETREGALQQIRRVLAEWVASGQLVLVEVPPANSLLGFPGHLDPNDPLELAFVEELNRQRREDTEQALAENDQRCPNSSSTPTT